MKSVLIGLPAFVGRHWFRIIIVGVALFVANRKHLNLQVQLGGEHSRETQLAIPPATDPVGIGQDPAQLEGTSAPNPSLLTTLFETERAQASGRNPPRQSVTQSGLFGLLSSSSPPATAASAPKPASNTLLQQLATAGEPRGLAFIKRFAHVAQAEQQRFGIPASIILANGLLHTHAGKHPAARELNAYFTLPCGTNWSGDYRLINQHCFRRYETAWLAFRDHSLYLSSGPYQQLHHLHRKDYRAWANGLEQLGFNNTANLAAQLTATIEHYNLTRFDQ